MLTHATTHSRDVATHMKKLTAILFPLFIITVFTSNSAHRQEQSTANSGEAVFYEIFPTLIDSIHTDRRLISPPPPEYFQFMDSIGTNIDITERFEKWQKSAQYKKWLENWEKKKDSIERDTRALYLTIPDSTGRTEENELGELIEHFGHHDISTDSFIESDPFRIDLSKLKTNQSKVRFIYQSKLPGDGKFWRNDYGKYIAASISFTKIVFDKTKSYGILNAGYVMAPLNGYGVRIFIKKNNDGKWVIDEVKGTWIS